MAQPAIKRLAISDFKIHSEILTQSAVRLKKTQERLTQLSSLQFLNNEIGWSPLNEDVKDLGKIMFHDANKIAQMKLEITLGSQENVFISTALVLYQGILDENHLLEIILSGCQELYIQFERLTPESIYSFTFEYID